MTFPGSSSKKLLLLTHTVIWFVIWQSHAKPTGLHPAPSHAFDLALSTNWMAAANAALQVAYVTNTNLDFQTVTNLLRQQSGRGNYAAQGLWGFVLVVQSRSPEQTKTGLELLRKSADNGYVPAILNLGLLLESGKFVGTNYTEAFHWFNLAADKGNSDGQLQLGGCYHYGLGTTQNLAIAAQCYRRSAEQTNYVAMKSLGYLLMNGLGVEKDLEAAKFWLTRAAREGGNRRAMYNLGVLCSLKLPDTNSLAQAFQWYQQSADLGDAVACFELSNFYYRGGGVVETNLASYRAWRLKAAHLGATEAQYMMGVAYRTGEGVPKDVGNSVAWLRKAAAKNNPKALYDLAVHYLESRTNPAAMKSAYDYMLLAAQGGHREAQFQCAMSCFRGDVLPRDFESGKRWLAKAADNGWARAEFLLFQLYFNGIAASPEFPAYPKDTARAIKWLRRAAEHDNLQAQSILAVMLIQGMNVKQDKGEAEKLLRSGAGHGYDQAQNDLGFAILNGDTGTKDFVEAATWCRLAVSQSTDTNLLQRAKVNLSNALSRLTADQRVEVERRVKNFQALPVAEIDPMLKGWEKNGTYQPEDGQFGH